MTSASLTILLVWGTFVIAAMLVIRGMGGSNTPPPREELPPSATDESKKVS